jgi:hypothetical protein
MLKIRIYEAILSVFHMSVKSGFLHCGKNVSWKSLEMIRKIFEPTGKVR